MTIKKSIIATLTAILLAFTTMGGGHLPLLKLLQLEHRKLIKRLRSVLTGQWE